MKDDCNPLKSLCFGNLENGLSVWRTGENSHVAHISSMKVVTYSSYMGSLLTEEEVKQIHHVAKTDDSTISMSQEEKVFKIKLLE